MFFLLCILFPYFSLFADEEFCQCKMPKESFLEEKTFSCRSIREVLQCEEAGGIVNPEGFMGRDFFTNETLKIPRAF